MRIIEWSESPIDRPLVMVGFPSQGLVGGISANFLIDSTDMWLHGTVHDDALPPIATVRGGRALPPIQIYAGSVRCGVGNECDQLVVVRADVVPDPATWNRLADALLDWTRKKNARLVVGFEGVHMRVGADAGDPPIYGVATEASEKALAATGVKRIPDATISGFSAALLVKAIENKDPVLALYVDADQEKPDAEAAARLLRRLDKLVPHIPIDPAPLLERAQKLEKKIRSALDGQRESMERIQENVMYV